MRLTVDLCPTKTVVELRDGVKARVWQGETPRGNEVYAFVTNLSMFGAKFHAVEPEALADVMRSVLPEPQPSGGKT